MVPGIGLIKDLLSNPGSRKTEIDLTATVTVGNALPATLTQHDLVALYKFWSEKKDTLGRLPGRADFSPLELKKLLPHIALLDVVRDGGSLQFRFRLCGTRIAESCGVDLTGISWSDADIPEALLGRTHDLIDRKIPYHATNVRAVWAPKDFQHYSVLALPLATDGLVVDMILYGIIFHPMDEMTLRRPE
jgi:hypothetical protein